MSEINYANMPLTSRFIFSFNDISSHISDPIIRSRTTFMHISYSTTVAYEWRVLVTITKAICRIRYSKRVLLHEA